MLPLRHEVTNADAAQVSHQGRGALSFARFFVILR